MKDFFDKYWKNMVAFSLVLGGVAITFVISTLIFGGIYSFLGLTYESFGGLLGFFCVTSFITVPLEIFSMTVPLNILEKGDISKRNAVFMTWGLDTLTCAFGQKVALTVIPSVYAPDFSILLVSLLMGTLSLDFEKFDLSEQEGLKKQQNP